MFFTRFLPRLIPSHKGSINTYGLFIKDFHIEGLEWLVQKQTKSSILSELRVKIGSKIAGKY